jgi:hypothetical protein
MLDSTKRTFDLATSIIVFDAFDYVLTTHTIFVLLKNQIKDTMYYALQHAINLQT